MNPRPVGPPLAPATVVGPYEILSVLGAGGQATVYRARHGASGRVVALKFAHGELGPRLRREAEILASLDHKRIVRVEGVGEHEGAVYLVMEFLPGGSLADRLHPSGDVVVSHENTLKIAEAVLEALAYAHGRGVVHRDVKPANILFDERGEAKVADFGIGTLALAAAEGGDAPLIQSLTRSGGTTGFAGTPAYMAPEQEDRARAENGRIDGRADLFALGKVLYETLTGRSARTVRPISRERPDVPTGWDDYIFKLVEERPRDRYASAVEAHLALLAYFDGAAFGKAQPPFEFAVADLARLSAARRVPAPEIFVAEARGFQKGVDFARANRASLAAREAERAADRSAERRVAVAGVIEWFNRPRRLSTLLTFPLLLVRAIVRAIRALRARLFGAPAPPPPPRGPRAGGGPPPGPGPLPPESGSPVPAVPAPPAPPRAAGASPPEEPARLQRKLDLP